MENGEEKLIFLKEFSSKEIILSNNDSVAAHNEDNKMKIVVCSNCVEKKWSFKIKKNIKKDKNILLGFTVDIKNFDPENLENVDTILLNIDTALFM
jgi:hypothetical protein